MQHGFRCHNILCRQSRGPTACAASGPGGVQTGAGSLPDDRAFKFRQGAEYMKNQLATRRRGIDGFRKRAQADMSFVQALDGFNELLQGSRQPIQLPDHERIVRPHVIQGGVELRTLPLRPGCFFGKYPAAPGRLQGIQLQSRILVPGRNPGIADKHTGTSYMICRTHVHGFRRIGCGPRPGRSLMLSRRSLLAASA